MFENHELKNLRQDRLAALIGILERVPSKHFDMDTWWDMNLEDEEHYISATEASETLTHILSNFEVDCGTTACIAGWASTHPEWGKETGVNGESFAKFLGIEEYLAEKITGDWSAFGLNEDGGTTEDAIHILRQLQKEGPQDGNEITARPSDNNL